MNRLHATRTLVIMLTTASFCALASHSFAFEKALRPFLTKHCFDCHAGETAEAGLDLSKLSSELKEAETFATWERIYDRVRDGEMPPEDAEQPTAKHRDIFVTHLFKPLNEAHARAKGTVLRRLNRREYENTMNDLFGTNLELAPMLPEDGRSHEFDNVGEALSISMVQMQRYLEAADLVMDRAIAKTVARPESKVVRASYADTRGAENFLGKQWLKLDDGAVVFYQRFGYPTGMLREANVRADGFYKVRVTGYAHQSKTPITFSIGATTFQRGAERPTFSYHVMPPGKPTTIEIEAFIKQRYMIEVTPWGLADPEFAIKNKGVENYRGPGLAISHIEVEGPITREFPSRGHRMIFDGIDRREIEPPNPATKKKSWYKPQFEVATDDANADARQALRRIAAKAFRRPVNDSDVEPYLALFESEVKSGAKFEQALRTAVAALFCSPDFLYLREQPGNLDDYALAARLSYFLARTSPDDELLAAAASGKLTGDAKVLRAQTERLLKGERADRFIVDFTDACLICGVWISRHPTSRCSPSSIRF